MAGQAKRCTSGQLNGLYVKRATLRWLSVHTLLVHQTKMQGLHEQIDFSMSPLVRGRAYGLIASTCLAIRVHAQAVLKERIRFVILLNVCAAVRGPSSMLKDGILLLSQRYRTWI